jgi:D-alanine-D-alanine ligase
LRKWRILALVPEGSIPPDNLEDYSEKEQAVWKMEYDVVSTLQNMGHSVTCLDVRSELGPIGKAIESLRPHVVFNMLEEFHGFVAFDSHVVSYLELLKVPYTGCNPRGLILGRDKALTKKILSYHRIHAPGFAVFPKGRRIRLGRKLRFPLFVKSLTEEASTGISQASIVHTEEQLQKRVEFVHESVRSDAIAEEYVEGRELNLGVLGNRRVETFPVWELVMSGLPEGTPKIATQKVKFDLDYQDKYEIRTERARDLPDGVAERMARTGRRVYRLLGLSGYARLDFRLRDDGTFFLLEANPNPDLSLDEDFALAAEASGSDYPTLVRRIVSLGMRYHAAWYD